jgi:tRNA pseudouridine38-40 synthase
MTRLRLDLQYDGTDFHGWQIQPNAITVQEEIENALTRLNSNQKVEIVGCGRTDTGVHAMHYVAHCDMNYPDLNELQFKLNGMMHKGIAITEITEAHPEFHARFDATKRTYRYFIDKRNNPFNNRFAHFLRHKLNVEVMNEAAKHLLGKQDFESFAKHHSDVNNFYCEVFSAFWTETDEQYIFEISANRFLRNMVRAIVGTLVDVGLAKIEPTEIQEIIAKKSRSEAGTSVPGKGLFLWKIEY